MKLTSDLHLSLESLTETDMARLSEGVARFDTLLVFFHSEENMTKY